LELSPTSVKDTFVQASFRTGSVWEVLPGGLILFGLGPLAHIRGSQLFKDHGLVLGDQLASLFVVEIFPLITNMSVSLADSLRGFSPSL